MILCLSSSSGLLDGHLFQFVSALITDVWDFLSFFFQFFLPHFKASGFSCYIYCLGTQLTYTYKYVYIH